MCFTKFDYDGYNISAKGTDTAGEFTLEGVNVDGQVQLTKVYTTYSTWKYVGTYLDG